MDASYDEIPLHVQVPVRVFSARCNSIMAIIFFDFFGKPAQITIPAERQPTMGTGYEVLRELLYALARSLEPKGNYYMAARYIPVASQIEEMLRDFMLDAMPPPATSASPVDWLGQFPLEWFLSVGRQQFLLTEDVHGKVCAMREATWPPEGLPPMTPTKDLPVIPRELPSVSTAHLKVLPARCGRNRIRGTTSLDLSGHGIGLAHPYTFACMRELGARAASEGCHRAMAFQIQQLDRIAQACHGLSNEARQRRDMCVPDIRAVLYHDLATTGGGSGGSGSSGGGLGLPPGRLPVGVLFDELPQVLPLRAAAAPPDVYKDCVLKICKTVEWLMDVGIGWGGSVGADHKGNALLDAIFVDAFCRPWLIEGFTEAKEGKALSDRISVHMLRMEFGLMGVEQSL